jgi:toxin-antitoxin system PIN domain toxin
MPGVIDTNLLLYAANVEAPEHGRSHAFLMAAGQSTENWYLTEGILYEFLRVATHPRVFPRPLTKRQALAFLEPIWGSPAFTVLPAGDRHWELLRQEVDTVAHPAGNLFFDIRTVVLMREHGIRTVYTADTDFLQFRGIEIVNPLAD